MMNYDSAATLLSLNQPCTLTQRRPEAWCNSDVLFIDDVARMMRTSRSTIERRRRRGSFPIPELPAVDNRPRWSRQAVERYLSSTSGGMRVRRGGPRRVN
jgi:hypothetical protein